MNFLIKLLASALFTGYSPVASGTAGSALALAAHYFLVPENTAIRAVLTVLLLAVSVPVSTAAEKLYGKKDDGRIVIDEVAGFFVSALLIPHQIKYYAICFLLFRLFDVWKPLIRRTQDLPGGWGIVIDDFLAGIYSLAILQVLITLRI